MSLAQLYAIAVMRLSYVPYHNSKVYLFLKAAQTATQQTNIQEQIMSATSNHLAFNEYPRTSYIGNVAVAARQLLAALLAVKPGATVSVREQYAAKSWLRSLAADSERHSPNLATELRFMAARD